MNVQNRSLLLGMSLLILLGSPTYAAESKSAENKANKEVPATKTESKEQAVNTKDMPNKETATKDSKDTKPAAKEVTESKAASEINEKAKEPVATAKDSKNVKPADQPATKESTEKNTVVSETKKEIAKEPPVLRHPKGYGLGMHIPTKDHLAIIENSQKIHRPGLNKVGAFRSKHYCEKKLIHPRPHKIAMNHEEELNGLNHDSTVLLPPSVDNSQLPSFPPIGNQGQEGSCVAWATTYYQASHEAGLLNGWNNKANSTHILSPKWTYNLINSGMDMGSNFLEAYQVLAQNGAASILQFPYDGNYTSWDLSWNDWVSALSYRMAPVRPVTGLNWTVPADLNAIKTMLNNGHVLTIGTWALGWVTTTISANRSTANKCVGQQAISCLNAASGAHMITIVGYDDEIWIDVNGNGQVDPGETGAFLLANSWGSDWGNNGLIWVSYDAFRSTTAVPDGPRENRVTAAGVSNNYAFSIVPKKLKYEPSLVALFEVTQSHRNALSLKAGSSLFTEQVPNHVFTPAIFQFQGGDLEFNGASTGSAQAGTFALDLTGLKLENTPRQRFYLSVDSRGMPTALNSFALMDLEHGVTLPYKGVIPLVHQKFQASIDYAQQAAMSDAKPLAASIVSPISQQIVHGIVPIQINETSVVKAEFVVDNKIVATDTTEPFQFFYDTEQLSNGVHRFAIICHDENGFVVTSSVPVNVQN